MSIHARCEIDPTAVIADSATIGPGVVVGPNSVIESDVELGPNVVIGPYTTIREGVRIFPGAIIGMDPQDVKYKGTVTTCEVGKNTIIREYVTINRGTDASKATIVGADCFLMSYVHIGHDCRVGNGVTMASKAAFGGHCEIGDKAVIGGMTGAHQFVRVGKLAMVGGSSGLRQDAPPYMITAGATPARVYGVNVVGLRRNGFGPEDRMIIRQVFRLLYRSGLNISDALERIRAEFEPSPEIKSIMDFYKSSRRGVARGHSSEPTDFNGNE